MRTLLYGAVIMTMSLLTWTIPFIEEAKLGKFTIVLSDVTVRELTNAPSEVKNLPSFIPEEALELTNMNNEQLALANSYIQEGALPPKLHLDAQHVAIATVLKVDSLVSWNFRHMVNFFRIRQYNSINLKLGYSMIDIRTPKEVTYGN